MLECVKENILNGKMEHTISEHLLLIEGVNKEYREEIKALDALSQYVDCDKVVSGILRNYIQNLVMCVSDKPAMLPVIHILGDRLREAQFALQDFKTEMHAFSVLSTKMVDPVICLKQIVLNYILRLYSIGEYNAPVN